MLVAISLIFEHPGSAQNKGTNPIQKNASDNQSHANASVTPVVAANASENDQKQGANVATQDEEYRVTAKGPVTVNSHKDPWDKALVVLTGLLVIVGGFQIWFLWNTVNATRDNAKAAESQARSSESAARAAEMNATAARANADALINMERGWLLLNGVAPKMLMKFANLGRETIQ